MMNKTLHVGHKRGHRLTDEQMDVLVEMAGKTHMDRSWFGQIDEAVNACGDRVHVVWDIENKRYMSVRHAVKTLDSGISCPEDFLDGDKLAVYKNMLDDLGIVSTNSRILGVATEYRLYSRGSCPQCGQ